MFIVLPYGLNKRGSLRIGRPLAVALANGLFTSSGTGWKQEGSGHQDARNILAGLRIKRHNRRASDIQTGRDLGYHL